MRQLTKMRLIAGIALTSAFALSTAQAQVGNRITREDVSQKNVTMVFDGADVRDALKTLFSHAGVNYVLDQAVQGITTVSLTDVSFVTALESILKSSSPMDLTYQLADGIYTVAPKPTPAIGPTPRGDDYGSPNTTRSRIVKIHLKYADAIDIALALGGTVIVSRFSGLGVSGFGYGSGFASGMFGSGYGGGLGAYATGFGVTR